MINEMMEEEEDPQGENSNSESKVKVKSKKENQFEELELIVKEMREVDNNILLSEMNKIIGELKQVYIEKQTLESKTMLDNINQQNEAFSKLLDKSADQSADSSMLSKI